MHKIRQLVIFFDLSDEIGAFSDLSDFVTKSDILLSINQKPFIFHRASLLGHIPAPALVSAGVGRSMESGSRTVL